MARNHPSGDADVNRQHIERQNKGDRELAGATRKTGAKQGHEREPAKGRPDREEGQGTTRDQRR
jgi:hypothetical protein